MNLQLTEMKKLLLTPELMVELNESRLALWASWNGEVLKDEDRSRLTHLLDAINDYEKYGHEERCIAVFHHGPGHQSRSICVMPPGHEDKHAGIVQGERVRWTGTSAMSGYNDELPDEDDD